MLSENEKASGIPLAFLSLNNLKSVLYLKNPSGFPMNIDCLCA
ncbi:hypothetical protein VCHC51A1_3195 [Vibrio cholerae HC-51A1]|nr:hypothetical protein VIF_003585 [Vibrio cholerae TM 11079-80]EGR01964.1 hypothetical protein VCHE39_1622 [Vibrio cholerae HE39]EGS57788.1 hypothetical protein VCHC02A1_3269 [Vibrio cholerae HC-02A1]EJH52179.1 hypothetical protein VCHC43B1_1512 [Vibrio cholerae HC-43B1]EJH61339.1 hypothetical protein VCHE45_3432 [Vibrio cholerae HE-45]EKG46354.1 hypothetical protein VCHC50A1_3314 [Vibrio cholerae HC-50A1]EKG56978.1 hypothetical protein VCHC55A1_3306 [Vibrio cholerae HC-55A1]EKG57208.1 hypo